MHPRQNYYIPKDTRRKLEWIAAELGHKLHRPVNLSEALRWAIDTLYRELGGPETAAATDAAPDDALAA